MSIYVPKTLIKDPNNISDEVLRFLLEEHQRQLPRLKTLSDYYGAKHAPETDPDDGKPVTVAYGKYIVDVITGYYLGEPVKYDSLPEDGEGITPGVPVTVDKGQVKRVRDAITGPDISAVLDAYDAQTISDIDSDLGRDLGIFGTAYELIYSSDDPVPVPKSAVISPLTGFMVRDDSVDHKRICFIYGQKVRTPRGGEYWRLYVITAQGTTEYISDNTSDRARFTGFFTAHHFGQIPVVEYRNGGSGKGDFEAVTSIIDAYSALQTDRVTDKRKFVNNILAIFGAMLSPEQHEELRKYRTLSGLPTEARVEYIRRALDESQAQVLSDSLARDIHRISMTVDMTDEAFAGTSSGQALRLKLLTMSMLAKSKIRSMERGLKKRFEIYNNFLHLSSGAPVVDKNSIHCIFTLSMPIDYAEIVNMVVQLQGIVDDETLLGQLWFVRDPRAVLEKVRAQQAEKQSKYLDLYGLAVKNSQNRNAADYEDMENEAEE